MLASCVKTPAHASFLAVSRVVALRAASLVSEASLQRTGHPRTDPRICAPPQRIKISVTSRSGARRHRSWCPICTARACRTTRAKRAARSKASMRRGLRRRASSPPTRAAGSVAPWRDAHRYTCLKEAKLAEVALATAGFERGGYVQHGRRRGDPARHGALPQRRAGSAWTSTMARWPTPRAPSSRWRRRARAARALDVARGSATSTSLGEIDAGECPGGLVTCYLRQRRSSTASAVGGRSSATTRYRRPVPVGLRPRLAAPPGRHDDRGFRAPSLSRPAAAGPSGDSALPARLSTRVVGRLVSRAAQTVLMRRVCEDAAAERCARMAEIIGRNYSRAWRRRWRDDGADSRGPVSLG